MGNIYSVYLEDDSEIMEKLDNKFIEMLKGYKVHKWRIPSLIEGDVLKKCGYFESMPHQLTCVHPLMVKESTRKWEYYLTPAACIHIYPELQSQNLKNEVVTTLERVYRYEGGDFSEHVRNCEFLVREFVAIGTPDFVQGFLEDIKNKALSLLKELSISGSIQIGSDHFYPSSINKMARKFQIKNKLKYELVTTTECYGKLALASFNYHGFHFSKAFNFDKESKIVTGCVGFGLDRWIYRLMER